MSASEHYRATTTMSPLYVSCPLETFCFPAHVTRPLRCGRLLLGKELDEWYGMDCRIEKGVMLLELSLNWQWGCGLSKNLAGFY